MSHYAKYTAQGNDYIVVDPLHFPLEIGSDIARKICDRQYGLGADGILYGPLRGAEAVDVRIFNANGSECGRSGNGLGIYAHYLHSQGYTQEDQITVETSAGRNTISKVDLSQGLFVVDAGPYSVETRTIPTGDLTSHVLAGLRGCENGCFEVVHVRNGNPHCIVQVKSRAKDHTIQLGRYLNDGGFFPEGVNVQAVEIIDRTCVKAEVFERGAGYTLSSAASACAIQAATHALGLTERSIEVLMPGGTFRARIAEDGHVHLTLSVTAICDGDFSDSYLRAFETP